MIKKTLPALLIAALLLTPATADAMVIDPPPYYTEDDVDLLARLIYAEARGEERPGQILVGQCVMDRLADGQWGATIYKVIMYRGQFAAPAKKIGEPEVFEQILGVARAVLDGERYDAEHRILYFQVTRSTRDWYMPYVGRCGRHAYYGE